MPVPLLFVLLVAQGQAPQQSVLRSVSTSGAKTLVQATRIQTQSAGVPAQAANGSQQFSSAFNVAEPNRIALTPKIDGVIDEEEWDPLSSSSDFKTYFQWEPLKLHIAAKVPAGHDLLASFDLSGNGWLIGKDNLEVRLSSSGGNGSTATISCRVLDGTGIQGPRWIDLPGMTLASTGAASSDGSGTTFEATLVDPGIGILPAEPGAKLMLRMDDPETSDAPAPAYLPRLLSPVTLSYQRSAALPPGLRFNTEGLARSSAAGESIKLRLTFNGNNSMKLQRIEIHSEGSAKNDTNGLNSLFPKFDDKGRSYVDYSTPIAEGSASGFRVLKSTLLTADNINAVMESSYRIGPVIDFEIPRLLTPVAPLDRSVRYIFYAKSNSFKQVRGEVTISVPDPLRVLNGADHKINIATNRGKDRQTFELFLPPNTSGTFPVKFTAMLNGKKMEQVQYITIGGL
ncbi:MAG: hypothetical protein P4L46_24150 [Fimbriimonas sp.]|nr:hypothetical protein [Fimbriimonas sp.]